MAHHDPVPPEARAAAVANERLAELEQLLKFHDWTYDFSDDGYVYQRGKKEREAILRLGTLLSRQYGPAVKTLWERYAPKEPHYPCPF